LLHHELLTADLTAIFSRMNTAQTVAKALSVLELLAEHKELTAKKITTFLDMNRSTAYRLLGTLTQLNYVRHDPIARTYALSTKILTLASGVTAQKNITDLASPFLKKLHDTTEETIHLAVLDRDELVYLEKIESMRNLRVAIGSKEGGHAPLYCTGIGKILLTGLTEEKLQEYLSVVKFTRYTEHTIADKEELIQEMKIIRKQGFAEDREEHEPGVYCMAGPIKNSTGSTIAAFSISLPSVRCTEPLKSSLRRMVLDTSQAITKAIHD